jgi:ligand-binding SRPBCC domain-containing protein
MLPPRFHVNIKRTGLLTYKLSTSQLLRIDRKEAFKFFEDPKHLCDITPLWLEFCMLNKDSDTGVHENAEFDYTIKFMGIPMRWRSRIIDYQPPERFTDVQLKGPYKSWAHLHVLEKAPAGTLMRDEVTYKLHIPALMLHPFIIKKKLIDIFSYRSVKIAEWADKVT